MTESLNSPLIYLLAPEIVGRHRSKGDGSDPDHTLSAEKVTMTESAIVPSTMRNPSIAGSATESRQNPTDDLEAPFRAIRAAHDRGDRNAAKLAWIDLGALLGLSPAEFAPASTVKRTRKRTA